MTTAALETKLPRLTLRPLDRSAGNEALAREIRTLKQQLNAVILAHNYQVPEIQDLADYVGDSLGLAQQAADSALIREQAVNRTCSSVIAVQPAL